VLISKYGFTDILAPGQIVLDPSRMAAQIVSGIGFIGGGVIFVRKDLVRGLNTAATIWVTSAVGMACGAGLPLLAIAVSAANFLVIFGFPIFERRLPRSRWAPSSLQVSYQDGRGVLRDVLVICTQQDFAVTRVQVERVGDAARDPKGKRMDKTEGRHVAEGVDEGPPPKGVVTVVMEVRGPRSVAKLVEKLTEVEGVTSVDAGETSHTSD
jgi:putative Mg2+ transporter-C (MgtC) family protein